MAISQEPVCDRCDKPNSLLKCSCGVTFCQNCLFNTHLGRYPNHQQAVPGKREKFLGWVTGTIYNITYEVASVLFQKDEASKWFGLVVEKSSQDRITKLVETPRFLSLISRSRHAFPDSPKRQYPSIISFVGETGAGKSTLSKFKI
jgi:hypothetical protein